MSYKNIFENPQQFIHIIGAEIIIVICENFS